MGAFGNGAQESTYKKLMKAYGEPHRHYHTLRHLHDCLTAIDPIQHQLQNAIAVELALWFHDGVYDPRSPDNEGNSAAWLRTFLANSSLGPAMVHQISQYILATQTHDRQEDPDGRFVLDLDLKFLGSDPPEFQGFESQIRQEYAWVPWPQYCRKRRAILQGFLHQIHIYQTPYFRSHYENQARKNLQWAIAQLTHGEKYPE